MSFPESERIVFAENPLVEVISQLTFPTILAIAAEPPAAFQERLRDQYPIYERVGPFTANLPAEVSQVLAQFQLPTGLEAMTHRFSTEDRSRQVALTRDFVALTVTDYTRWEVFRAALADVKTALEEIYRPAFYSRVGLRYRDVVDRERLGLTDDWPALLQTAVLGILSAETGVRSGVRATRGEALVQLDDPPGASVKLVYGTEGPPENETYAIDADWFTLERSNPNDVLGLLDRLNHHAGNLFRWAITPKLRAALGSRNDQ